MSSQEIIDEDYSLINIACTVLYMSAKYDSRVSGLDFYTFFAYISRLNTYNELLASWDLEPSDIQWPELIFNRIEAMVFESFPRFQINLISPIEVCYDLAAHIVSSSPEWHLTTELLQEAALNTYLCISGK